MENQLEIESFLDNMRSILMKVLCVKDLNIEITLETDLVNGVGTDCLGLSSIDYVDFLVLVETEYDIIYDFDTAVYTIGDVYNFIKEYRKGKE